MWSDETEPSENVDTNELKASEKLNPWLFIFLILVIFEYSATSSSVEHSVARNPPFCPICKQESNKSIFYLLLKCCSIRYVGLFFLL